MLTSKPTSGRVRREDVEATGPSNAFLMFFLDGYRTRDLGSWGRDLDGYNQVGVSPMKPLMVHGVRYNEGFNFSEPITMEPRP